MLSAFGERKIAEAEALARSGPAIAADLQMALGRAGDRLQDLGTWTHQSLNSLLPGTDYSISKSWDPAMHMELNDFHRTLEEMAPSADQVTEATAGLWDNVDELDGGVGALGGTMDLATLGMDGMSTSMGMGAQEALAYAGQMGTLEDETLAAVDAFRQLAAAPRAPTRSGGSAGGWVHRRAAAPTRA